mmetsp:Transcript_16/g.23  ORF Transcript_16/g.23 Transcript_16/m.23 type:complete len:200 (-) Transcript_16:16-615(-)
MQSRTDKALPFLAVGRVKDGVTLAYYFGSESNQQRDQIKEVFGKLMQAASSKLTKGQRTRLQWNDGSVCCLMDDQGTLLYCLVTSLLTYPEILAYQLLYDLQVKVLQLSHLDTASEHSLNDNLQPIMKDLVSRYEDQNNFPQLQTAVTGVKSGRDVCSIGQEPLVSRDDFPNRNSRMMKRALACVLCMIVLIMIAHLFR